MPISFENVFYTYGLKTPFKQEALLDANFSIKDGSFTCVVGHTGCGKSTLIQQMNGLLVPTSGDVKVNNFVISSDKKKTIKRFNNLRKEIGIVFQFSEYQLFDETVEEDVAFGPTNYGVSKQEAIELAHKYLKEVGIDETYYKKSPFELSGGEKRRVAIAGVLALEPKILVLDEPTAGLDPSGSKEMLDLFSKLNKEGITIIVVTHDMNVVFNYASEVIVMDKGHIIKQCSPDKLFLEDVEKYSLETPQISLFIQELQRKGMNLDLSKIKSIDLLVEEIIRMKNKK